MPTDAFNADVIITEEVVNHNFGHMIVTADISGDGANDIIVGNYGYGSNAGRAYAFYNDGLIPSSAGSADSIWTGAKAGDYFGYGMATGDFDGNRKIDFAVGLYGANSGLGKFDIFTVDAAYSKPDYMEIRGGYRVQGTMRME